MSNIPRDYQQIGIININDVWRADDVVMYANGTGLGKTVTFMEVIKAELINGGRVIMIAHRKELINQAWKTLYKNRIYAGIIMNSEKTDYSLPCQVCSIQTITRRKDLPAATLIVIDEGHRINEDEGGYKSILLLYPNARVLIVTATPTRLDGKGFLNIVPGKTTRLVQSYNLKQGIENGWLTPLDYHVSSIPDMSDVGLSRGDYEETGARKVMEMAPLVESYLEYMAGKQCVGFAINVDHSISVVQKYTRAGIPAEHVDGTTPQAQRDQILRDFNAGFIKVLYNCAVFTEGTDFERCDGVQLAAPTKSLSRFMQQLGRGTRPVPGLVDLFASAFERKQAIVNSDKPKCIVLDNGGLWIEHLAEFSTDFNIDWQPHFEGTIKKQKKDSGEIEMLVFIAEDKNGVTHTTTNVREVEGMRLIKVTNEIKRKGVVIKSLKEFDRLYYSFSNIKTFKRPGFKAVEEFIKYCNKNSYLMIPEIWDAIERTAITNIDNKKDEIIETNKKNPIPEHLLQKSFEALARKRVSRTWLIGKRTAYAKENADQMASYIVSAMNLTI